MGKFWSLFFVLTAVIIVIVSWFSPALGWWFPGDGRAHSTIGKRIDDLFYMIMVIVAVTFIATQAVLGYVLWRGATIRPDSDLSRNDEKRPSAASRLSESG